MTINESFELKYDNYLKIIKQLLFSKFNIQGTDFEYDILNDIYIMLAEKETKCVDPFIYIYTVIRNELCNPNSQTYKKYISFEKNKSELPNNITQTKDEQYDETNEKIEIDYNAKLNQDITNIKNKIIAKENYWYAKEIFNLYYFSNYDSIRDLSKQLKIPHSSLFRTIKVMEKKYLTKNEIMKLKTYKKIKTLKTNKLFSTMKKNEKQNPNPIIVDNNNDNNLSTEDISKKKEYEKLYGKTYEINGKTYYKKNGGLKCPICGMFTMDRYLFEKHICK